MNQFFPLKYVIFIICLWGG